MIFARSYILSLFILLLLYGNSYGEELQMEWRDGVCREYREAYHQYLSAYYEKVREKPERILTVRPLTEKECEAVLRSIEFIGMVREKEKNPGERDFLIQRESELRMLAETGRIKVDEDPEEARYATRMTTHIPSESSEPFEGDIYVHDAGILQGVSLPLDGLRRLSVAEISREVRGAKMRAYEGSLFDGLVLLSSYLVHECSHRVQHKLACVESELSPSRKYGYILEIEDPAYTEQYRYLAILSGVTGDEVLKRRLRSIRDTIVSEINVKFPDLQKFREAQKEWR